MNNYEVWVYNPARTELLTIITEYTTLDYVMNDNDVGAMTLVMPPIVPREYFTADTQLEIWRTNGTDAPVLEGGTQWFVEKISDQYAAERLYIIEAVDAMGLLNRRAVMAWSGSFQASKELPADDMMKQIIRENIPPAVIDPDGIIQGLTRIQAGIYSDDFFNPLVSIAGNQSLLPTIKASFAWDKLLSALQAIASTSLAAGIFGGFRFVQVNPISGALEFRTYAVSTGPDRRATLDGLGVAAGILLTPENGSLVDAVTIEDYTETATAIVVGGEGEGVNRALGGARIPMVNPWGYREVFVEKTDTQNLTLLNNYAAGQLQLRQRGKRQLTGTINETSDVQYGRDFGLGYYVTAEAGSFVADCRVTQVAVSVSQDSGEVIAASVVSDTTIS